MNFSDQGLPVSMLSADKAVNVILIEEIFKIVKTPKKAVRNLLGELRGEKIPPTADCLNILAGYLWGKEFRFHWYKIEENRRDALPSLATLVLRWIVNFQHAGVLYPTGIPHAFERKTKFINGKRRELSFPVLKHIDKVTDVVLKLRVFSEQYAELYCWSLLELVDFASVLYPQELTLKTFGDDFRTSLRAHGLKALVENLEGIQPALANDESIPEAKSPDFETEDTPYKNALAQSKAPDGQNKRHVEELLAEATKLASNCRDGQLQLSRAIDRIKTAADDLKPSSAKLLDLKGEVDDAMKKHSVTQIDNDTLVAEIIRIISNGIPTAPFKLDHSAFDAFWCSQDVDMPGKIIDAARQTLAVIDFAAVHKARSSQFKQKNQVIAKSFAQAKDIFIEYQQKTQVAEAGMMAENIIKDAFIANSHDIKWTLNNEPQITPGIWTDLARYYSDTGKYTATLASAVRTLIDHQGLKFLDNLWTAKESQSAGYSSVEFLRHFTMGELELIAISCDEAVELTAVAQFSAFLELLSQGNADLYTPWSVYPLNQASRRAANSIIDQVFHLTYLMVVETASEKSLRLKQLIAYANLVSDCGDLQEGSRLSFRELTRPPSAGGPLQKLFSAAYLDLFGTPDKAKKLLDEDNDQIALRLSNWRRGVPKQHLENKEHETKVLAAIAATKAKLRSHFSREKAKELLSALGELTATEASLVQSLDTLERSDVESSVELRAWLNDYSRNQVYAPSLIGGASSTQSGWTELVFSSGISPDLPRSYREWRSNGGRFASSASLATDLVMKDLGLSSVESVARSYVESKYFEGYRALAARSLTSISPDYDRQVELLIDRHVETLNGRFSWLQSEFEKFRDTPHSFEQSSFEAARRLLESEEWEKASSLLDTIASELSAVQSRLAEIDRKEILKDEIRQIGGVLTNLDDTLELEHQLKELKVLTAPQRRHIAHIEGLIKNVGVDASTKNYAIEAARVLSQFNELPKPELCEFMEYLFAEIFVPISDQFKRSKNLMPEYFSELRVLTQLILGAISRPDALSQTNSKTTQSLSDFASMLSSLPELDAEALHRLSKNLAESLEFDLPDHQEGANRNSKANVDSTREPTDDDGERRTSVQTNSLYKSLYGQETGLEVSEQLLANWLAKVRTIETERIAVHVALVALASRYSQSPGVMRLLPTRQSKGIFGDIVARLFIRLANLGRAAPIEFGLVDSIEHLVQRNAAAVEAQDYARQALSECTAQNPAAIKWLWDHLTGDSKQAEGRAALMTFLAQSDHESGLMFCLMTGPVDFEFIKAKALAAAACKVYKSREPQLIQSFSDFRRSGGPKAFLYFADHISTLLPAQSERSANISVLGESEVVNQVEGMYRATLNIVPNTSDWPQSIDLILPIISPFRNSDGSRRIALDGPFVAETNVKLDFSIVEPQASNFSVNVECIALSISGKRSKFTSKLQISVSGAPVFHPMGKGEIERAFDGFPSYQMRGSDYIPRSEDEKKIERALVLSNTIRSLWISSPRRSGKTSTLYMILDQFSHKADRDIAVVFLTIDRAFDSTEEFNNWVWRKVLHGTANSELREKYQNIVALGVDLPFEEDCGTFLAALSDRLLGGGLKSFYRVIYLVDEIDKFASMHFEGGRRKDVARDIIWQIRGIIGIRRDVGFVFAGSSAAKKIFVTEPESPFFNGISLLELTPFSCNGKDAEEYSRMITEPGTVRGRYYFSKETLQHLIWICAGIPYYMKLLAGATIALARQRYLLKSDVSDGLQALFDKNCGINQLDEIGGDPGADELRTMALQGERDKVLVRAVLYSVAELHSPAGGGRLHRGRIFGEDSPLVSRYKLTREDIDRGVDIALDLGILATSVDRYPEIFFSIPILGESLRSAKGRNWAAIDHQLTRIAGEG